MGYLKDKYFYWKLKEFFFVEWRQKSKVFYLEVNFQHSFFKIFSLQKKKSHNLNCFVSPTEQSCAYHILYNSDVI